MLESPKMRAQLNELFNQFDRDNDGALSYDEMDRMISTMQETFPQLEVYQNKVRKLFEQFDTDHDDRAQPRSGSIILADSDPFLS